MSDSSNPTPRERREKVLALLRLRSQKAKAVVDRHDVFDAVGGIGVHDVLQVYGVECMDEIRRGGILRFLVGGDTQRSLSVVVYAKQCPSWLDLYVS